MSHTRFIFCTEGNVVAESLGVFLSCLAFGLRLGCKPSDGKILQLSFWLILSSFFFRFPLNFGLVYTLALAQYNQSVVTIRWFLVCHHSNKFIKIYFAITIFISFTDHFRYLKIVQLFTKFFHNLFQFC